MSDYFGHFPGPSSDDPTNFPDQNLASTSTGFGGWSRDRFANTNVIHISLDSSSSSSDSKNTTPEVKKKKRHICKRKEPEKPCFVHKKEKDVQTGAFKPNKKFSWKIQNPQSESILMKQLLESDKDDKKDNEDEWKTNKKQKFPESEESTYTETETDPVNPHGIQIFKVDNIETPVDQVNEEIPTIEEILEKFSYPCAAPEMIGTDQETYESFEPISPEPVKNEPVSSETVNWQPISPESAKIELVNLESCFPEQNDFESIIPEPICFEPFMFESSKHIQVLITCQSIMNERL